MSGTEDTLIRTKFKDNTGQQLFCEAAFIVQALITVAFICGPIIGGFLNDTFGMRNACLYMAFFGAGFLCVYTIGGIFVYCTSYNENLINLNDSHDIGLNRSRGGDELARLLRTLTEDKSDRQSLIKKKKKRQGRNPDSEISPGVRREAEISLDG